MTRGFVVFNAGLRAGDSEHRGVRPRVPLLRGLCADGRKANLEDFRYG